jgi:hypothetical protein
MLPRLPVLPTYWKALGKPTAVLPACCPTYCPPPACWRKRQHLRRRERHVDESALLLGEVARGRADDRRAAVAEVTAARASDQRTPRLAAKGSARALNTRHESPIRSRRRVAAWRVVAVERVVRRRTP